jgi:hypothetical protein
MAMVIWLFAGGGEAEIRGLVPFLEKHFPGYRFDRKTPVRQLCRPGVKPPHGYGRTGQSLVCEVEERLRKLLADNQRCDSILVIDDLDCRNATDMRAEFLEAIDLVMGSENINKCIGFASPELEAWLIADWDNSFARHPDFRGRHERMRYWLATDRNVPFNDPESFSDYDPDRDTCIEKLSEVIIESSTSHTDDRFLPRYSKALHTPSLLLEINPNEVRKKCPLFREIYTFLTDICALY